MSIRIKRYSKRGATHRDRWEVDIRLKQPSGEHHREKRIIDGSREAAKLWANQRAAHLITHGTKKEEIEAQRREMTVAELIEKWLERREEQKAPSLKLDRQRLHDYIVPLLGRMKSADVRPRHIEALIQDLLKRKSLQGGTLAPRTVRGAYFLLKQVFQMAVVREWVIANPVVVERRTLPEKKDKNPRWRLTARFSRDEVERLISDPRIPEHRRVAYAIEFLSGVRTGEASALKWRDYETGLHPLGRLICSSSYNTARRAVKETKTEVPREIPVHPVLAKVLAEWRLSGWHELMKKARNKPKVELTPDDLIIPSTEGDYRRVNYALKTFYKDLEALGMPRRRHYDSRRTFISMALDGGASKDVLRYITHPSPADAFDLYNTPSWTARCAQVLCIQVQLRRGQLVALSAVPSGGGEASVGNEVGIEGSLRGANQVSGGLPQ